MPRIRLRRNLAALVAAMGLGLASPLFAPLAQAHVMVPLSVEQLTDASDYIARGVVTNTWVDLDENETHWTHVQIEIDRVYKGPEDLEVLELEVIGGIINGDFTRVAHTPRFAPDERVLVFAEDLESGRTVPTGLSQGKWTIRISPEDGREMLVRFNPSLERPYDPRFIPHPEPGNRLYLDDYLDRVHSRIRQGWTGEPIPGKSNERLRQMHGIVPTPGQHEEVAP